MKTIILSLAIAMPISVFAHTNVISFKCTSADVPGIHKFDAHGIVSVDDDKRVVGVATIITEKADEVHSAQTFDEVRVAGFIRHFKAGELTTKAFDQLVLKADADYLKTLNLLLDYDDKIASRAFSVDNFSYRSNCKISQTFN